MQVKPLLSSIQSATFLQDYLKAHGINHVEKFLYPQKTDFDDPFDYPHMNDGIQCFNKHIINNNTIGILVDPDCDGQLSAAILVDFLYSNFKILPIIFIHKGKAHGLHPNEDENLLEKIIDSHIQLLCIPDAGSNDDSDCTVLKNHGIDILILDHHEIIVKNSNAIVINHHLNSKLNQHLSGTGVVHKFIQAYCQYYNIEQSPFKYMDMVAVSLISDSCQLNILENRSYIYYGLSHLQNKMLILMQQELNRKGNTPEGWSWGGIPYINSLCRSDQNLDKLVFFSSLAGLKSDNDELKIIKQAHNQQVKISTSLLDEIISTIDFNKKVLIGFSNDQFKSYSGLIANKIMSKYHKPVLILRQKNEDTYSGSVRSPIPLATKINNSQLAICTGHEQACGIEIHTTNLSKLIDWFEQLNLDTQFIIPVTACIVPEQISNELCSICEKYKNMWGHGLTEPIFYFKFPVFKLSEFSIFQKRTNTFKINKKGINFIKFFVPKNEINQINLLPDNFEIELIGKLSINKWNNIITPQCEIIDYEIHDTISSKNNWEDIF